MPTRSSHKDRRGFYKHLSKRVRPLTQGCRANSHLLLLWAVGSRRDKKIPLQRILQEGDFWELPVVGRKTEKLFPLISVRIGGNQSRFFARVNCNFIKK